MIISLLTKSHRTSSKNILITQVGNPSVLQTKCCIYVARGIRLRRATSCCHEEVNIVHVGIAGKKHECNGISVSPAIFHDRNTLKDEREPASKEVSRELHSPSQDFQLVCSDARSDFSIKLHHLCCFFSLWIIDSWWGSLVRN